MKGKNKIKELILCGLHVADGNSCGLFDDSYP
jgi:hypothetical protein